MNNLITLKCISLAPDVNIYPKFSTDLIYKTILPSCSSKQPQFTPGVHKSRVLGRRATKFCVVARTVCEFSRWNLPYVTLLNIRILRCVPRHLCDICAPLPIGCVKFAT
jgi:hypothetical protein